MASTTNTKRIPLHLRSDLHLLRKLWHIVSGLTGLLIYKFFEIDPVNMAIGLAIVGVLSLSVEIARLHLERFNLLVLKVMGPFMRESERNHMSGMPFYAFGVAIALGFFPEPIAVLACLFLIFSDPFSSVFGILFGTIKIMPNKSLQGSFAGFVICYLIAFLYGEYYVGASLSLMVFCFFAGIIGSFSELVSNKIDDNLTIPVVSGALLTLLNIFVGLF